MKPRTFTQHALDRFMERSGIINPESAGRKLFNLMARATKHSDRAFRSAGWTLIVTGKTVQTVYKTGSKEERQEFHRRKAIEEIAGSSE